jgi:hypothetical protein
VAGYSGTPLIQKLGIKPGHRVAPVNAPDDFDETLLDTTQEKGEPAEVVLALFPNERPKPPRRTPRRKRT